MKYAILASTWASFFRAVAAAAIGTWLAFAICPAAFATDGAQAAAAAKEAAANFDTYLGDVEKSKGKPDYSKPPASEYLKRIFDADALASLPAPKANDFGWLLEWLENADVSYKALAMFGVETGADIGQAVARNVSQYGNEITSAIAFVLRLAARTARTGEILFNSLPTEQRNEVRRGGLERMRRGLVQTALGTSMMMSSGLKPQNARLMMTAIRDTVADWAPYASPDERNRILTLLDQARARNANAGIDEAVTAVGAKIRGLKN